LVPTKTDELYSNLLLEFDKLVDENSDLPLSGAGVEHIYDHWADLLFKWVL